MLEHGGYQQAYGHGGHGWEHHSRGGFHPHGRGGFHPYGRGGGHPGHGWGLHVPPCSRGWPGPFVRPHGRMAQGCGADVHGRHLVPPHGHISEDWGPHMFHERCIHGADGGEDHNHGADGGRKGCHGRGGRGYDSRGRGGGGVIPRGRGGRHHGHGGRGGEGHVHDLDVFISEEDLGPHMFPERCIHGPDGGEDDDHNHGATHSGGRGGCHGRGGGCGGRHHWHGGRGGEGHEHDLNVFISEEDLGPHMFPERCIHGPDGGEDDHNYGATHSGGRGGCHGRGGGRGPRGRGGRHHWHGGRGGEGHNLDVLVVEHIPDITAATSA